MDGSGRTSGEAYRITAVHACGCDHQLCMTVSFTDKSGISIVGRSASFDTVVAICATIEIDDHRLVAIDGSMIDQEFQSVLRDIDFTFRAAEVLEEVFLGDMGKNVILESRSRDQKQVGGSDAVEILGGHRSATRVDRFDQFFHSENVSRSQVIDGFGDSANVPGNASKTV